jgi:NADH-quinone oxidoreductase subunit L
MFIAVGSQNYTGAVFHMITHAFFKALMFLGAGSVILAMAHEQDMRRYGNLRKYLPITFVTFMIGWLAISGIPPFAGFWSKDEVLAGAWNVKPGGPGLWIVGIIAAVLTAFYMTRLVIMTFFGGEERWRTPAAQLDHEGGHAADGETADAELVAVGAHASTDAGGSASGGSGGHDEAHDDAHGHDHELTPDHTPHESPPTMTIPLIVLGGLAVIGGLLNLPFSHRLELLHIWLEPVISGEQELPGALALVVLAVLATLGAVAGVFLAYRVYQQKKLDPARIELPVLAHAWYINDSYAAVVGGPGEAAFQGIADADANIVDGAVRGVGAGTKEAGKLLKPVQSGLVRTYALGVAVGAAVLVAIVITRMSV